jgi:hypothetical protein
MVSQSAPVQLTRRRVLQVAGAAVPGASWAATSPAAAGEQRDALFAGFQNPPDSARPFVRWWWNGDKLEAREILRELDVLKAAGFGGVEINPIAFPAPSDPLQIPAVEWLSEPWIRMLKGALEGARARGLTADSIVGSGWPFGGRFLASEERSQILSRGVHRLAGPTHIELTEAELLREAAVPGRRSEMLERRIRHMRLIPGRLGAFDPGVDVMAQFRDGVLRLDVPAGEHFLYILVLQRGFQTVINGAPGSDGPVLNHLNAAAVRKYLSACPECWRSTWGRSATTFGRCSATVSS